MRTTMVQRYVPDIAQGDKHIVLIAGKHVTYSLARISKPGETRDNLNAGGMLLRSRSPGVIAKSLKRLVPRYTMKA